MEGKRCAAAQSRTMKNTPLAFVQTGPMDPWLGPNAKGLLGRPGAPLVGNLPGLARARGPGPMSPRCLAQIVTPARD